VGYISVADSAGHSFSCFSAKSDKIVRKYKLVAGQSHRSWYV